MKRHTHTRRFFTPTVEIGARHSTSRLYTYRRNLSAGWSRPLHTPVHRTPHELAPRRVGTVASQPRRTYRRAMMLLQHTAVHSRVVNSIKLQRCGHATSVIGCHDEQYRAGCSCTELDMTSRRRLGRSRYGARSHSGWRTTSASTTGRRQKQEAAVPTTTGERTAVLGARRDTLPSSRCGCLGKDLAVALAVHHRHERRARCERRERFEEAWHVVLEVSERVQWHSRRVSQRGRAAAKAPGESRLGRTARRQQSPSLHLEACWPGQRCNPTAAR